MTDSDTTTANRRRTLWPRGGLWRHPDFVKLWSAETISQFGSQVSGLAIPLVAIITLDVSPFQVALLTVVEFAPFILISLPAGVWVDRMRRRPILIIGDLGRAALLASIPIAYGLDMLTIEQLYVVGFAIGVLTVFFDVAYQSYLPSLVNREQLVDAISFVGSGLFVVGIRRREEAPERPEAQPGESAGMRAELSEGLRYVLGHRYLRWIAASTATFNFFGSMMGAIFLVYAVRGLHLSPGVIGLIFAVGNVGYLAGAISANRVAARFGVGVTIVVGAATGIAALLIPLAPQDSPIPFLLVSGLIVSFGVVVYNVTQLSYRQAITPERLQGRMNSVMRFIVWGVMPLGTLVGGAIATGIDLKAAIWVGAIGQSLAFLPVLLSPVRSLDRMPDTGAEPSPADATAAGAAFAPGQLLDPEEIA